MNQRDTVAIKSQANGEQLPNYYGLLRLNPFESDRTRIVRALRSRVDLTRSFQSDKGTRDQQRLLNQLGDAQRCLLDPVAKTRYDARLRAQIPDGKCFDPYHKWLGIPPCDQPPNHYQLLGLSLFEDDAGAIENAADRQMAHVRTFQSGQHAAASQQVLNELSSAKLCLLNPPRKAGYDQKLRIVAPPVVRQSVAEPPIIVTRPSNERNIQTDQASPGMSLRHSCSALWQSLRDQPYVWQAALGPLIALILLILAIALNANQVEPSSQDDSHTAVANHAAKPTGHSIQDSASSPPSVGSNITAPKMVGIVAPNESRADTSSTRQQTSIPPIQPHTDAPPPPDRPAIDAVPDAAFEIPATPPAETKPSADSSAPAKRVEDVGPTRVISSEVPSTLPVVARSTIGLRVKLILPGQFLMGSPSSEAGRDEDEGPQHRVKITKPCYMGTHEVTVGQFARFITATGYRTQAELQGTTGPTWRDPAHAQVGSSPVVQVSWNDAVAFCDWLSQSEGKRYRLPTEAEWEYACRAGSQTPFHSGDDPQKTFAYAAFLTNSTGVPQPVGQHKPNSWGLYDMHGNVWEWCRDWYGEYEVDLQVDPQGAMDGHLRTVRGGAADAPIPVRSAYREYATPETATHNVGFRVVCEVD